MKIEVYLRANDGRPLAYRTFHGVLDALTRNQRLSKLWSQLNRKIVGRDAHPEFIIKTMRVGGHLYVNPSPGSEDRLPIEKVEGHDFCNGGFPAHPSNDVTLVLSIIVDDEIELARAYEWLDDERHSLARAQVDRLIRLQQADRAFKIGARWGSAKIDEPEDAPNNTNPTEERSKQVIGFVQQQGD